MIAKSDGAPIDELAQRQWLRKDADPRRPERLRATKRPSIGVFRFVALALN
jgi:hypothetical protein